MRRAWILAIGLIIAAAGLATMQPSTKTYAGETSSTSTSTQTATQTSTSTQTSTATATSTPVRVRLPIFAMALTHTPTATPTETSTPTVTPTSSPTTPAPTEVSYSVSTGHLSGGIAWKDQEDGHPKNHYYMDIEYIKFYHWLFNNSDNSMERYKILGINVTWPDPNRTLFHTSWTTSPDYVAPRCFGPNGNTLNWGLGLRCGADQGSAQSEDQIGGNNDVRVDSPGWYTVQYFVCQSATLDECHQSGEWHQIGSSIQFRADPPPLQWHAAPPPPFTGETCQLVMTGADKGRLVCTKPARKQQAPIGIWR